MIYTKEKILMFSIAIDKMEKAKNSSFPVILIICIVLIGGMFIAWQTGKKGKGV